MTHASIIIHKYDTKCICIFMSAVLNLTAQTLDAVCHDGDLGERLSSVLWDNLKVHKQDCTHT